MTCEVFFLTLNCNSIGDNWGAYHSSERNQLVWMNGPWIMVRVCVKLTNQPKEMVFTLIKLVHFVVFDCVFFFFPIHGRLKKQAIEENLWKYIHVMWMKSTISIWILQKMTVSRNFCTRVISTSGCIMLHHTHSLGDSFKNGLYMTCLS